MLCESGKISVITFFGTICMYLILFMPNVHYQIVPSYTWTLIGCKVIYFAIVASIIRLCNHGIAFDIAIRSYILGAISSEGLYAWLCAADHTRAFGVYMMVIATFHYSEFLTIAIIHPETLSIDTFMLNHSMEYKLAAVLSWCEFFVETYYIPDMKKQRWLTYVGLFMCVAGEVIRKVAMFTASSNFNHLVQNVKVEGHVLVTHGIYRFFRHPSYVGWFYWSIGTQIILLNPICIIAYTTVSWMFFNRRILIEEITLLNFFGQQYCDYQMKVPSGLPFIKGYKVQP